MERWHLHVFATSSSKTSLFILLCRRTICKARAHKEGAASCDILRRVDYTRFTVAVNGLIQRLAGVGEAMNERSNAVNEANASANPNFSRNSVTHSLTHSLSQSITESACTHTQPQTLPYLQSAGREGRITPHCNAQQTVSQSVDSLTVCHSQCGLFAHTPAQQSCERLPHTPTTRGFDIIAAAAEGFGKGIC